MSGTYKGENTVSVNMGVMDAMGSELGPIVVAGVDVNLSARYDFGLSAKLSSTNYDTIVDVNYEGYTVWKLTFAQDIWRGINLILAADNLFDYRPKTYYYNSYYTTGITLSATLSLSLEQFFSRRYR